MGLPNGAEEKIQELAEEHLFLISFIHQSSYSTSSLNTTSNLFTYYIKYLHLL